MTKSINAIPPKAPITITLKTTISRDKNTSMVKSKKSLDLQIVTMKQLKEIINHMNNNTQALDNKVNEIGMTKVKLPFIKCFDGTRSKLKGFLLQIRFKIMQESLKVGTPMD